MKAHKYHFGNIFLSAPYLIVSRCKRGDHLAGFIEKKRLPRLNDRCKACQRLEVRRPRARGFWYRER
jgi:hypothetical protein